MANCPNCGSGHIQIKQETDVNWGRAIAGYALFGVVGAAVGAVSGEDRNVNACLDGGTSWKAEDLYKLLQVIKDCTGVKLNLAREHDRLYMNSFISEVGSYLKEIPEIEGKADQLIADVVEEGKKKIDDLNGRFGCGCLAIGLILIITVFQVPFFAFLIFLFGLFYTKLVIDNEKPIKEENDKLIQNARNQAVIMKREAEKRLNAKIKSFMDNNPL
jgi:vacuolar-type H+-ATPase subunit H